MKGFVPIFFEFGQERDALLALDTLEELGYKPELLEGEPRPTLHIHLDAQELTSAIEIAQAHGGRMVEKQAEAEQAAYAMAYDLEGSIRIPAHTVNEDWTDSYAAVNADAVPSDDEAQFDPSADDYNRFSAGIRI